jgi:hypothetical protein
MGVMRLVCAAVIGLCVLSGCGDDHSHDEGDGHHDDYTEACQAIIDACHDIDDGTDPDIAECHAEWAHENDDAMCVSEGERCIGLCEAAAGDAGSHDGGEHDEE